MTSSRLFFQILTGLAAISTTGCTNESKQRPQMVQMCVRDDTDIDSIVSVVERVARQNKMYFIDRSRETHQELMRVGHDPGYRLVNASASRVDGLGIAVGNLGLGPNEVAIGITDGSSQADGNALVNDVVDELKSKWEVRKVPAGQGAIPTDKCKPYSRI